MSTVLSTVAVLLGGMFVWRVAKREWQRINRSMDAHRTTPRATGHGHTQTLQRDPETGVYRPSSD